MKQTGYPYDRFTEYIVDELGLSRLTATSYASQCRRIVRSAGVNDVCDVALLCAIDRDKVEDFLAGQKNSRNQTPFRRSWTTFSDFLVLEGFSSLCSVDPCYGWEDVPEFVAEAIRELDSQDFAFRTITQMRWDRDDVLTKVLGNSKKIVITSMIDGEVKKTTLPLSPLVALAMWGYPQREPTPNDPLIPREPNSRHPMSVSMMRKVAGIIN